MWGKCISSDAQGLPLALCSGVIPINYCESIGAQDQSRVKAYKASADLYSLSKLTAKS